MEHLLPEQVQQMNDALAEMKKAAESANRRRR